MVVEIFLLGEQAAQEAAGILCLEAACRMVWMFGQTSLALLQAHRITRKTLTGFPPQSCLWTRAGSRIGLICRGKQLKTARAVRVTR